LPAFKNKTNRKGKFMQSFHRTRIIGTLVLALSLPAAAADLPTASPQSQGLSPTRLARIRDVIQSEINADRMPGAVVLVARKGAIVHSDIVGFQDKDAGKPLKRDTIFRAYSMTKPIVSVMAMMLVEEGRLQLTDPVSKFFPAMAKMEVMTNPSEANSARVPAARPITVHDLLRHTSGLTYAEFTRSAAVKAAYQEAGLFSTEVPSKWITLTPQQQIEAFSKAPLLSQPGSTWEYSLSTDLLGRVLEAVSNKPLSVLLDERLIQPLGMKDTSFVVPASKVARLAEPLKIDPTTGGPMMVMLDVTRATGNDSGGAGMSTTADDYLRFCQMLLNGGTLDGKRYLSRTTVALMTSDHLGPKVATPVQPSEVLMGVQGYTFGLGFMVRQGPGIAGVHGSEGDFAWGGLGGTFFWVDPKEQLIGIMMAQTPGAVRQQYRRMIKTLVYQALD
jgi:CubicO group peptidase (beta-lactamase class C family)